ncbi:uncharacterized protein LOC141634236 [Silene latifolia]|uniref:uncharacterized protein LOC141634236 n=1 Tax=Silene latifolia TaxID=37657 RepID=UPI003D77CF21
MDKFLIMMNVNLKTVGGRFADYVVDRLFLIYWLRRNRNDGTSFSVWWGLGQLVALLTVGVFREGFMSRLDNNLHVQASDVSDGSSDNDSDAFRDDGSQANCASEILDGAPDLNDPTADVLNVSHDETSPLGAVDVTPSTALPSVDPGIGPSADLNHPTQHGCMVPGSVVQSSNRTVGTGMDAVHKLHSQGALNLNPAAFYDLESPPRYKSNTEPCNTVRNCSNEETDSHQLGTHVEGRLECDTNNIVESRPETSTSVNSNGSSNDEVLDINAQESPGSGHEIDHEDFSVREEADVHNAVDDQLDISGNLNDHDLNVPELDWQGVSEFESVWECSPLSDQWRDNQAETDRPRWAGEVEVQSHEALEDESVEQIDQDEYWDENHSLETGRDWLGMVSGSGLASDRVVDTYYFSDDVNVYHIELRELVNRRRVSSLLDSDFRENLDRLIQSYVDRQTDAPDDWEHHEILPPFVSRNQELLHTEREESEPHDSHANGNEPRLPPRPPPLPQADWGWGLHQTNWARRNIHQQSGTKWELINDLRIDMTRLHQRLNNMQMMLEACMDMQVELQRSVRQEVSAALNRSNNPSESLENILPKDSFKWDSVRKGVCCICSSTNIDSLLYRCGHMCTCTNCANVLLQGKGKCPMCQAHPLLRWFVCISYNRIRWERSIASAIIILFIPVLQFLF